MGGTVIGTVMRGGFQVISNGLASGTVVLSGASETLSGGLASGTVVGAASFQYVLGGVASGTVVSDGGTEVVASGGVASETVVSSGGTIDLPGLIFTSGGSVELNQNLVVTVTEGGSVYQQQLSGTYTGLAFQAAQDSGTGTLITLESSTAPCYVTGTRILTRRGKVAVEDLNLGDMVLTLGGGARPIIWLGRRRINIVRHPAPRLVWPIRVRAGAIEERAPLRDLLLSPDHALYVDGVLLPVRLLVNGVSIVTETACRAVTYHHIELDAHDLVFAEGQLAESYLDPGDRATFAGAGATDALPNAGARTWEMRGCAELVQTGPRLAAVVTRLRQRAIKSHRWGKIAA